MSTDNFFRRGNPPRTGGRVSVPAASRVDGEAPSGEAGVYRGNRGTRTNRDYGAGLKANGNYRPRYGGDVSKASRRAGSKAEGDYTRDGKEHSGENARFSAIRRGDGADGRESGSAPFFRDEAGEENLLAGRNPIREALKAGRPVEKLLVSKGDLSGSAMEIVRLAKEAGAVIQYVDRSRLDAIYPVHQGMIGYMAQAEYSSIEDILSYARERGEDPFVILLDGVTDPHNLGAVIRTAQCAGAHGVIIPQRRAAGLGPACAKAAAGALSLMRIARVNNINRAIDELKEAGLWILAAALEGEDAFRCDLTGPIGLVIGGEGDGISRLTLEKCDRRITLPMQGGIDSLNASVAAGILIYEVLRARRLS